MTAAPPRRRPCRKRADRSASTEAELARQTDDVDARLRDVLLLIPNLPSPDAPDGASDRENPVLRVQAPDQATYAEHQRVPHWDIGTRASASSTTSGR